MPEFDLNGIAKKQQLEKRRRYNAITETLPQDDNGDGVDDEIYEYLNLTEPKFFLYAGADSGKTRLLVNAIYCVHRECRDTHQYPKEWLFLSLGRYVLSCC